MITFVRDKIKLMRVRIFLLIAASFCILATGCKSSTGKSPATFCDTAACMSDTLRFTGDQKLEPYIYVTTKNCKPENIIRSYKGMGENLTIGFGFDQVNYNKDYFRVIIDDTAAAYILFNDCLSGRGYYIKLPYSKTGTINKRPSAINSMDKKFAIDDHMVAYIDKGNIFVEETRSGKKAMMTFGKMLDIDYDAVHEYLDSVNVSPGRIWVKVKVDNQWTELEKKISLE